MMMNPSTKRATASLLFFILCSSVHNNNVNAKSHGGWSLLAASQRRKASSLSQHNVLNGPMTLQRFLVEVVPRGGGGSDEGDAVSAGGTNEGETSPSSKSIPDNANSEFITETIVDTKTAAAAASVATSSNLLPELLDKISNNVIIQMIIDASVGLKKYMKGPKMDTLLLLGLTAINTPICKKIGLSPILGFLSSGIVAGPHGKGLINDIHTTELLADLGVVLFLFEMGIHLSFKTLMQMKRDVFGLGLSQFIFTGLAIAFIGQKLVGTTLGISNEASIIIAGGLALSSSAFVLQLLKDKDELSSRFGKASFGVLLLQDLMVVPLMVMTPLLATAANGGGGSGGSTMKAALSVAGVKAIMALSCISGIGKFVLSPIFEFVSNIGKSQESFVGLILVTVLGMSFLTEGLGLSNTLGAFLAGVLLSDTPYKYNVEKEIAPFRGILVGLFFFSVGFEIDIQYIYNNIQLVLGIVLGIVSIKFIMATLVCLLFGLGLPISQRIGFILSQGGEFAFVTFRLARSHGLLSKEQTKLLLTCVSLTMATTPVLESLGANVANKMLEKQAAEALAIKEAEEAAAKKKQRGNNRRPKIKTR